MAHFSADTPRSKAEANRWQKGYIANNELRALLNDPWLRNRDYDDRSSVSVVIADPAMDFFPTGWSDCLSEDTLAELIVDAYSSAFCDAFLDGAVSLVEVSNKWNAMQSQPSSSSQGLQQSASAPSLQQPKANRRLRNTSQTDKGLLEMGLLEQECTAVEGFTMSGLSKDPWDAWNSRNFHKCKPLDPFVKRIEKATEAQRPQRRVAKRVGRPGDHRKYVWPMTATNFPSSWERESFRPRTMKQDFPDDEEMPPDKWLLKVRKDDGRTMFPYSLVSHKAFLESQPDSTLKDKAHRIAPLRLSSS
jgi:hypothetical protein